MSKLITLSQAGPMLGVSPSTLRGQVQKGKLRAELIGKTYIVSEDEIERYRREHLGQVGRPKKSV